MDYERALALHHQIEALYPEVENRASYFRLMRSVSKSLPLPPHGETVADHDRTFCALAIKAATTKRAVCTLTECGDGDNAMVLARVILENAILMGWMLEGNGLVRLETYIVFTRVLHERLIQIVEQFYSDNANLLRMSRSLSDPYSRAIARDMFSGNHDTWAYFPARRRPWRLQRVRIKDMFLELQHGQPSFAYEMAYSRGSQFVHSGPLSLAGIIGALARRSTFAIAPTPVRGTCAEAMEISNIAMLLVLGAIDDYVGVGLAERLKRLQGTMTPASASGPVV